MDSPEFEPGAFSASSVGLSSHCKRRPTSALNAKHRRMPIDVEPSVGPQQMSGLDKPARASARLCHRGIERWTKEVTADRVDMTHDILEKHYDKAKNEQMERREDYLRTSNRQFSCFIILTAGSSIPTNPNQVLSQCRVRKNFYYLGFHIDNHRP